MKKDDSVFFFTLVDFLLTSLFFGLVLFALSQARSQHEKIAEQEWKTIADSLRKVSGISDLTVLTDQLTRLGPMRTAEQSVLLVRQSGGIDATHEALAMVARAGGSDTVAARLERLHRREGAGKPHCLFTEVNGRKEAIVLATVVATDSTLSFESETQSLRPVLATLGRTYSDVRSMSLRPFRRTFERLVDVQPGCMYTIDFIEHTRFVDARDAVRGIFYTRIRH
jgi:hypothetical protein